MPELVLLLTLSVIALFLLGRAVGSRGATPSGLARTVGRGGRALASVGESYRPVEHLRH
ncbi:hypothetical protein [Ornithinimicrobium cerasi]|uniref:Uncharacterized protein n=1 Tax=Ornithinimicrobium cerasi TaxID=2248773 RepID=A0A285VMV4_9MICO|nr:hypothetical protein [Ornithinimicrobium cerasi]SOC55392.1 hypothetical protein SAMN05421879_10561 [Ornithinimicrobium cerasi]